jgi:periplasmic glucans biosynthesis protein
MQRDRAFTNYEDIEAQYERRPSAWVTPQGAWGPGRVELLQLPTADETNDNIVAYWVPERVPAAGQPLDFAYRLAWQGERQARPPNGWTVQSRRGQGFREPPSPPSELQFIVDFDGPALRALPEGAAVEAVVSVGSGARLVEAHAYRNPVNGTWRMTLRADRPQTTQPLELRAFLRHGDNALTETWTSILPSE